MDCPVHDANVTPTNVSEWDFNNSGRVEDLKVLMYNMAWHKYTEKQVSLG